MYFFCISLLFFIKKIVFFFIFISFFDKGSNFRNRTLTKQKQELAIRTCHWIILAVILQAREICEARKIFVTWYWALCDK